MKKVILYIAESLDGFVATKDKSVAWLDKFNDPTVGYGYNEFIASIDTVVQGNTTYQQFKPTYEDKSSYVFTRSPEKYSEEGVNFVKGSIGDFVDGLDDKICKNIWLVGGPNLAAQFLNEGKINEIIIFTMPVLLGEGIKLFDNIVKIPEINLESLKNYKNGVVEMKYIVAN